MVSIELLQKYNVAIPRYTSYPTVPFWDEDIDRQRWSTTFQHRFHTSNEQKGISLYIHLPFCETLCSFCGCNKKITKNHAVEEEYLQALLAEWDLYRLQMAHKPVIRELHIGGGTPTFFSPGNLKILLEHILRDAFVPDVHEFSFEGHPNNTTYSHLKTLYELGFNRVSFGMQDSDSEVQRVINRFQPQAHVIQVVDWAREIGYESVNLDLVYGLPLQDVSKMAQTIQDALDVRPDRIAFYSYAHVPWTSRAQRLFNEQDLPNVQEKMALYQLGKQLFAAAGYEDIGMDHFALSSDLMVQAAHQGTLHRNFMGYTVQETGLLLGLGVSSISDLGMAFAQNKKTIREYYEQVARGELPVFRGYFLTEEDLQMRQYILDVACRGTVTFEPGQYAELTESTVGELNDLAADGLLTWNAQSLQVTASGKHFIRNICKAFDLKLLNSVIEKKTFSQAV